MPKLGMNDQVRGKSKKLHGKRGVVVGVYKEARQHSYDVLWDGGSTERVAARAISPERPSITTSSEIIRSEAPFQILVAKDYSVASDDIEYDSYESTSSEDDEEINCAVEPDVNINAASPDQIISNGREWVPCANVLVDASSHKQKKTTLHWPSLLESGETTHVKYFYLFYPMQTIQSTLEHTNAVLKQHHQATLSTGEFFCWLGIRLVMAYEPCRGPIKTYWTSEHLEEQVDTPRNFGERFKMSRRRFEQILDAFRLSDDGILSNDPWYPIRSFIDAFNARRQSVVFPGEILVMDEYKVAWDEQETKYQHKDLPCKRKIPRKLFSQGTELKAIADGETGILLGLEIMEGRERQQQKRYHAEFGEETAIALRLAEPYKGSGRTVIADSAFSSVKTLIQLESNLGLFFMGIVKTATFEYPQAAMRQWLARKPSRGSFYTLKSTSPLGNNMFAMCWADKKAKTIISNRGTTLPGSDSVRTRYKIIKQNGVVVSTERRELRIPRPHMVELFFSRSSSGDVHNLYRQGSLRMEQEWHTKTWWHRVFSSVFGMILTDAFFAYRRDQVSNDQLNVDGFSTFISKVAHQLIFNEFYTDRQKRNLDAVDDEPSATHELKSFIDLLQYKKVRKTSNRAQRRCTICKLRASFYCVTCSQPSDNKFIPICGVKTGRRCHTHHILSCQ